ncbi:DUF1837 domain-containing protein [uncultured Dokdonia sp.]|uniref:HamA C-terminal domain-containing protein n=1 Tax=uncultured Dokdonia sp. TaxID=575653 RepID=UPI002634C5B2|nr:DUF1837 domain-containing protein [uncultured Dokdonia sp.]
MDFKVLLSDFFSTFCKDSSLNPIAKKKVLSLINDFEDGNWRYTKFQNFIWDNIADTALSFRERDSLINQPLSQLSESAKKLRLTDKDSDLSKGSELSEILLYGIMKHYYKALPVVPKIYYKQNPNDNAKGADSVHIVVEDNDFSIWFGEAKFYNSIEDARLGEIITSVENSLKTDKIKKENSIITDLQDLDLLIDDNLELRERIKNALSTRESIDDLKPKLHIPILLLHECPITPKYDQLTSAYELEISNYHKQRAQSYFKKQINKFGNTLHNYSEISFHLILFPVPVKKDIIDEFIKIANFHKNR